MSRPAAALWLTPKWPLGPRPAVVATVALVLTMAGCTGGPKREISDPLSGNKDGLASAREEFAQVDRLLSQPPSIAHALEEVQQRCLEARLPFKTPEEQDVSSPDYETSVLLGVTYLDPSLASSTGYGDTIDPLRVERWWRPTQRQKRLYADALFGDDNPSRVRVSVRGSSFGSPNRGCIAHSRRSVFGSIRNYLSVTYLPQAAFQFQLESWKAPATRAATKNYRQCMLASGYKFEFPVDALSFARAEFGGDIGTPSAEEVDLATADATCQAGSQVFDVLRDSYIDVAGYWLQRRADRWNYLTVLMRRARMRANDIMS